MSSQLIHQRILICLKAFQHNFSAQCHVRCEASQIMIEEDLNGCLIIFELVGLQYFSLKSMNDDNVKNGPAKCRKVFPMVQLTFIGVVLITILVNFEPPMTDEVNAKSVLLFLIVQLSNLGIVLMSLISFIKSYTSTRRIKKIFSEKNLGNCEKKFLRLDGLRCDKKASLVEVCCNADVLRCYNCGVDWRRHFSRGTAGGASDSFSAPLGLSVHFLRRLNCQLATLSALLQNSFNYKSIRIIDNVELYVTQLKPADESLIKLRAAMKVYNLIFEIGSLISDSFGSTTLMLLINFVIAATAAGYEAFIVVVGGLPTDIITGKWAVFALRNKALIRPWIKQLAFMSSSSQSLCSYRQYLVVMRHNGW